MSVQKLSRKKCVKSDVELGDLFGGVVREGEGYCVTGSGAILAGGRTVLPAESGGEFSKKLEAFLGWSPDLLRDTVQYPPDPLLPEHFYLTDDESAARILPKQLRSMSVGVRRADGKIMRLYSKGVTMGRGLTNPMQEKVFVRKISGGQVGERAEKQYVNCEGVQDIAYSVLGRPTFAPIPLQSVDADSVYVVGEGLVGLADYFGDARYRSPQAQKNVEVWVKQNILAGNIPRYRGISDAEMDELTKDPQTLGRLYVEVTRPSQFHYLAATDLRVGQVTGLPYSPSSILREIGLEASPEKVKKLIDITYSYIYSSHGQSYEGIEDIKDFMRAGSFDHVSYIKTVSEKNRGKIPSLVASFSRNHGEAVGLCHGAGYELGGIFVETNTGGATAPRNVGVDGSIFDLDPISREKDFVGKISSITEEPVSAAEAKNADLNFSRDSIGSFVALISAGLDDPALSRTGFDSFRESYRRNYRLAAEKIRGLDERACGDELKTLVVAPPGL